jgi:5-methylcytosine-specific restriction endonuclease McrA
MTAWRKLTEQQRQRRIARASAWNKNNRARRLEISRASDASRKAQRTAYMRQWRAQNLTYARMKVRLEQHRRHTAGKMTPREVGLLFQLARGRCVYCIEPRPLTIDHFIPVSENGKTEWGNVVPACMSCNCSKNKWPGVDWIGARFGTEGLGRTLQFLLVQKAIRRHFVRLARAS